MDQSEQRMKVSVIVPIFSVSAYIERCIRSVMGQTYGHIECILVDDASPDDSILQCERLIAAYDGPVRFSILRHQQNRGLSAARNSGTDAATGDYILYLDSDDELTADCIEKLMQPVLQDQSIELVQGNYIGFPEGYPLPARSQQKRDFTEEDFSSQEAVRNYFFDRKVFPVTAWNKLIKRAFLNQNNLSFKEGVLWEDSLWTFYVFKKLSHLHIIPDVTYRHYKRPLSITTGTDKETAGYHRGLVFEEIASHLTEGEQEREAVYYMRRVCTLLYTHPGHPALIRSARLIRNALAGGQHLSAYLLLSVSIPLSQTAPGRWLFYGARALRNIVKYR